MGRFTLIFLLMILIFGCNRQVKKPKYIPGDDNLTSGTIQISVDESFRPVIDSQIKVFLSQHPNARIIAHYKPEAECLKDLLNDSIRMVIVTRGLSEEEVKFYKDTLQFTPIFGKIASDAIAVVVNNKSKDSIFSVSDIRSMLNGTSGYRYQQVMDGISATSTVRYMIDSVLRGQPFSSEVVAAKTSEEVINYVSNHPDAIGYVGVSWIGNKEDSTQLSFLKSVQIASLQCANCDKEVYVKPYQANIALKKIPVDKRGALYTERELCRIGKGICEFSDA